MMESLLCQRKMSQPCLIALFHDHDLPSHYQPNLTIRYSIHIDSILGTLELKPAHNKNESYNISIDGFALTSIELNPDTVEMISNHLGELCANGGLKDSIIKSGRRYRCRVTIPIPINDPNPTGSVLIEAGARLPGIADLRIDFKPAKLGQNGLSDVIALLDLITPLGGEHLITNGTLTRYDIAIDLWGGSVDQVLVFSNRSQKNGVYTDRYGCPETVYMGTPRSNRTVAYTKVHTAISEQSLRIERRMTRRCKGHEWPTMADPFQVVQLIHTQSIQPLLDGLIPQQFFDSVRIRGLNRVLSLLPAKQRKAIKAVLNDANQSLLPSTATIWKEEWPQLLESSGLGFLLHRVADEVVADDVSLVPNDMTRDKEAGTV